MSKNKIKKILSVLLFLCIIISLIITYYPEIKNFYLKHFKKDGQQQIHFEKIIEENLFLARSDKDTQIISHDNYTIGYNHNTLQANWVGYLLSKEHLLSPTAERKNNFRPDPLVDGGSAKLEDYRHSGYDRGHLAPAADFKFSDDAMSDTFYLSNMSPQTHEFNAGIWEKLEEAVRQNAYDSEKLYVITGPLFDAENENRIYIGENRLPVPDGYYKVLLVYNDNEKKAIGFIIPHKKDSGALSKFTVSVDDVEKISGIDFFYNLPDDEEETLESSFDTSLWSYKYFRAI